MTEIASKSVTKKKSKSPAKSKDKYQYSVEEYQDALALARVRRSECDARDVFQMILSSPVDYGEVQKVDGTIPVKDLLHTNTVALSRIGVVLTLKAMTGDAPSAKIILDYAGFKPSDKHEVELNAPIIMNDLRPIGEAAKIVQEIEKDDNADE